MKEKMGRRLSDLRAVDVEEKTGRWLTGLRAVGVEERLVWKPKCCRKLSVLVSRII